MNPLDYLPDVKAKEDAIMADAELFIRSEHENYSLKEFAEQKALDWKDPAVAVQIKQAVRRLQREKR